uniref:Uncharacterized protein n=1 Tax=Avena sativa TaxID=4498 RepID=A0ACD5VUZ7_AVESA
MENLQYHHQAASHRSASPLPPPPPPSPPLSPQSAAAEALANARWTPTVEQIGVLEGLYREGMRTPSAEQIQRLTARLREHGPIEGKNIFYWFQNHKARLRQRQKQQSFDYFARQFHRPQPLPMLHRPPGHPFPRAAPTQMMMTQAPPQHPACNRSEVMYMQHQQQVQQAYMTGQAQAAVQAAYYSQTQQQPLHYPRMDKHPRDNVRAQLTPSGAVYYHQHPAPTNGAGTQHQQQPRALHSSPATGGYKAAAADARPVQPPTLNLFPLHPTFAQREKKKTRRPRTASSAMPSSSTASFSWESEGGGSHSGQTSAPFYDFFSLDSGGR